MLKYLFQPILLPASLFSFFVFYKRCSTLIDIHTVVVKRFHILVKNMYIMAVFGSIDFYCSHFAVMNEWNTYYCVGKKTFMKFGLIIGLLKM